VNDAIGITLVGIARDDGLEIFTYPERLVGTDRLKFLAGGRVASRIGSEAMGKLLHQREITARLVG
jgi:hypothetical protein